MGDGPRKGEAKNEGEPTGGGEVVMLVVMNSIRLNAWHFKSRRKRRTDGRRRRRVSLSLTVPPSFFLIRF